MRVPLRPLALLVAASALTLAAACGGGSGPGSTATPSATASPTPTAGPASTATPRASATPTGTATPTDTPRAEPPPWPAHHPAGTRTGVEQVDAVLAALEARDADALVALALVQELKCVPPETQPGIGALVCGEGGQPGVPVRVFQASVCEGFLLREPSLAEHLASFAESSRGVYAVVEVTEPRRSEGFGTAAPWEYVVAVTAEEQPAPGFGGGQALLVGGGAILASNVGCNPPAAYLGWGGEPPVLPLPPPLGE